MNNEPHSKANNKPTYSRPSKLKRRRRTQHQSSTNNPLARYAAGNSISSNRLNRANQNTVDHADETTGRSASISLTSTSELLPSPLHETASRKNDMDLIISKSSVSKILNLHNGSFCRKRVSAEIDYFITSGFEFLNGNTGGGDFVKRVEGVKQSIPKRQIQHPILGQIVFRQNRNEEEYLDSPQNLCEFSFPQHHRHETKSEGNLDVDVRRTVFRDHGWSQFSSRGDGAIVSNEKIAFPSTKVKEAAEVSADNRPGVDRRFKMIKIISKHGATIRNQFDIDEQNNGDVNDIVPFTIIGKLPFGAIRLCMESKWLLPPDISVAKDEDESLLVGVMRHKIVLHPSDMGEFEKSNIGAGGDVKERKHMCTKPGFRFGWISDRSRLHEDPYLIAEML